MNISSVGDQTNIALCRGLKTLSKQHWLLWTHLTGIIRRNSCCFSVCKDVSPSCWTLYQQYAKETLLTKFNKLNSKYHSFALVFFIIRCVHINGCIDEKYYVMFSMINNTEVNCSCKRTIDIISHLNFNCFSPINVDKKKCE